VTDTADALGAPLAGWLASRLAVDEVRITSLTRPAGGRSNDTELFEAEWNDHHETLVLRRQPGGDHIFLTPDVVREALVVDGLAGSAVPVPRVIGHEADPAVLGAPFFVMEAVPGRVPLARPSIHSHGWLPELTRGERATLWSSGLDALVAIHAHDWRTTHEFLVDGGTTHLDRITNWYRWATAGREYPITDAALAHLCGRGAALETGAPVLVWGDARLGNMIFGADHRVAAVIDWEVATIGPPEIDVAHWLFFDAFATDAVGVAPLPGWSDRATTIATYEQRSGRTLGDLDTFELLEELFVATTLIRQADARVARGLSPPDTRMGHDNTVTQMLARRLGLPVPDLSPDYLAHRGVHPPEPTS
jgi:aminoglycoside phosphotransferase (APT) family kinase protein